MITSELFGQTACGCKIVKSAGLKPLSILPCDQHQLRICPRRVKRREVAQRKQWLAKARAKAPWRRR